MKVGSLLQRIKKGGRNEMDKVRRISANEIEVEVRRPNGFGLRSEICTYTDRVAVVSTEEFERLAEVHRPTRYYDIGEKSGDPTNGLQIWTSRKSGVRYLVDRTGCGMIRIYADEATCPPYEVRT